MGCGFWKVSACGKHEFGAGGEGGWLSPRRATLDGYVLIQRPWLLPGDPLSRLWWLIYLLVASGQRVDANSPVTDYRCALFLVSLCLAHTFAHELFAKLFSELPFERVLAPACLTASLGDKA